MVPWLAEKARASRSAFNGPAYSGGGAAGAAGSTGLDLVLAHRAATAIGAQSLPFSARADMGMAGVAGVAGSMGPRGYSGAVGVPGVAGSAGATGRDGSDGSMGPRGYAGSMGPMGPPRPLQRIIAGGLWN
jgi:hypothetical protein